MGEMGIPTFYVKNSKQIGTLKTFTIFWNFHVFFTIATEKLKNVGKFLWFQRLL